MIQRDYWTGISGNDIGYLTSNSNYPDSPTGSDYLTSLEATSWNDPSVAENWADSYGQRIYGLLHPPTTGEYTFWIACDDQCSLRISTDSDPGNSQVIADQTVGSTRRQSWDKYPSQKSSPVYLEAGKVYHIEVLHKEGAVGDNVAVGWAMHHPKWFLAARFLRCTKPGRLTETTGRAFPATMLGI